MRYLQHHDKPALILQELAVSYPQLIGKVRSYAALFQATPCTKAAIFSENRFEWVYALYAAWDNRCIAVPIDYMATADEVAYMLNDCTPEIVFCSRAKEGELRAALHAVSPAPKVVVFEDVTDLAPAPPAGEGAHLERDDADTALIIYTSGTTGSPKGAMLSFDNIMANADGVSREVRIYSEEHRALVFLPLHHVYPLLGSLVIPLHVGATCVFSPSMAGDDIRETLQRHGVTLVTGVPRFYSLLRKGIRARIQQSAAARLLFRLAERLDSPAFSRLVFKSVHRKFGGRIRFLVSGGAALDDDVARDFRTLGFDVLNGYGMTEAAPMIAFTRPGTLRIGSSGQPLPCNEVKIVDGEILARGRNIMQGYYGRPEETAAVVRDGWLHTGDLGEIDGDGYVFVTGRKKDTIVLPSGKNINPEEVENKILKDYPVVREIGVFAHEGVLHAVIWPDFDRLKEGGVHALDDHVRWDVLDPYNRGASPAKRIASFTLVKDELPKTRLGKIKRFQLAGLVGDNAAAERPRGPVPDDPEYRMIAAFIRDQTGREPHPGDHLEIDLGLDSLDKVSLMTFLENTFGILVQDAEMLHHATVGKLAEYARDRKVKVAEDRGNWHRLLHEDASFNLPSAAMLPVTTPVLKLCLHGWFRLGVAGLGHLPDPPVIFAANHQSWLDGMLVGRFLGSHLLRRTYFSADEQHFRTPWLRWFAARNNIIIMDMNRELKLSLQKMAEALRQGNNVVIFPEGSRTRDGKLGEFKRAFAILGCELGVPIVPVVLQGAYEAMPIGRALPRFRRPISVEFLPPLFPEASGHEALAKRVEDTIRKRLEGQQP